MSGWEFVALIGVAAIVAGLWMLPGDDDDRGK